MVVHQQTSVSQGVVTTRCGVLLKDKRDGRNGAFLYTGWQSEMTCPDCTRATNKTLTGS